MSLKFTSETHFKKTDIGEIPKEWEIKKLGEIVEIKQIAQEIVKDLGYYVRVADWNKKDYMKAKIRAAIKKILLKRINKNVSYNIVNNLSNEIVTQAEMVYGGA